MDDDMEAGITAESVNTFCDEMSLLDVLAERRLHAVSETFDRVRSLLTVPEGVELALEELKKLEQLLTQG
jgi:hypothetical protein